MVQVFHASNEVFRWPSRCEPRPDASPNGALGLWTAVTNEPYLKGFGENIYRLTLSVKSVFEDLPIHSLAAWNNAGHTIADYRNIAANCRLDGVTAMRLIEKEGECRQIIIIDYNSIATCELLKKDKATNDGQEPTKLGEGRKLESHWNPGHVPNFVLGNR